MKSYLLKKLIAGYKLSPNHKDKKLVALPYKYNGTKILVEHSDKKMIIDKDTPLLGEQTFADKFGRDKTYTLYYYQWQPSKNQIKLEL
jgi:hypothetical protein|tara:strand:+ start:209 stop:472 length:264 start_codon:yes stop_codon:yes gene_type:complete